MKLRFPVRCAIFDLDGVLLDTEPIYTDVIASIAGRYGKTYDWSVKSRTMGRGLLDAVGFVIETLELPLTPSDFIADYTAELERRLPGAPPAPHAEAFTRLLSERGVPMAVATSTEARLLPIKLDPHAAWFSIFRAVVCADHPRVRRSKPAPDIFLAAAEELGADPRACVVFEDAPAGVAAAIAAEMQVVALPHPNVDRLLLAGADWIISSFAECSPADLGIG